MLLLLHNYRVENQFYIRKVGRAIVHNLFQVETEYDASSHPLSNNYALRVSINIVQLYEHVLYLNVGK